MKTTTYIATGTIFDGKREYAPGDPIELTKEQADQLLGVKMVRVAKTKIDTIDQTHTSTDVEGGGDTPPAPSTSVDQDDVADLLNQAQFAGVVELRKGGWYRYGEKNFAKGKASALDTLRSDADLVAAIREELANIKPTNEP